MSVDAFRLENFMAFEDTGWIELRKINLLLGRNSSGKSAIIRALRLMKQSLQNERMQLALQNQNRESDLRQPLTFVIEGGVDLGSFGAVLHHKPFDLESDKLKLPDSGNNSYAHEEVLNEDFNALEEMKQYSEPVTFSFRGDLSLRNWDETTQEAILSLLPQSDEKNGDSLIFHVCVSYRQHKAQRTRENPDGQIYLWFLELGISQSLNSNDVTPLLGYEIIAVDFDASTGMFIPEVYFWGLFPNEIVRYLGKAFVIKDYTSFLPEISLNQLNDDGFKQFSGQLKAIPVFWEHCRKHITEWLDSIVHVGPIRPLPQRHYALTDEYQRAMKIGGWQSFLSYLQRNEDGRDGKVSYWLDKLGLGKRLNRYPMIRPEYEYELYAVKLKLDETGNGDERDITDIGFGASQILPVIVQCQAAAENAFILIEQPELHLHPEAQADVADMFIESVNEMRTPRLELNPRQFKENEKWMRLAQQEEKPEPVTRRYLIETHSETIFLRLRVELAETAVGKADERFRLQPESLVCYFVEREKQDGNSSVEKMRFDAKGEFAERPVRFLDFFGQDFKELLRMKRAR